MTLPDPESFAPRTATALLRLGLDGPRRPVDDLIARLRAPDGAGWFARAVTSGPFADPGPTGAHLVAGDASVDALTALKDRSKRLLAEAAAGDDRNVALAGYLLSIAAGLRHHGVRIGGRGRDELSAVLLDLAETAPEPYGELLAEAAVAEAG